MGVAVMWLLLACKQESPKQPDPAAKVAAPAAKVVEPAATAAAPPPSAPAAPRSLRDELMALSKDQRGDREQAMALRKRAMGELRKKDLAASEQTWAQAARTDPSWDWPFFNLACVASLGGKLDDALAYLEAVRERGPQRDMVRRIERDRDLQALRARPELTGLLREMNQELKLREPAIGEGARAEIAERALRARPNGAEPQDIAALFPDRVERAEPSAVADKLQRRIRHALRSVAKAPIALRDLISVPRDDGSTEIFGLYQFSAYEECVHGYATREEARAKCLGTRNDIDNTLRNNRACLRFGVLHARVGAPKPTADPDAGGSLTVSSQPWPHLFCQIQEYRYFFVADVDQDGALELFALLTTAEEVMIEARSEMETDHLATSTLGNIAIFSAGKKNDHQGFFAFSSADEEPQMMGKRTIAPDEQLYELHDLNRDGRLDLLRIDVCNDGSCREWEQRERAVFLYDRGTDSWEEAR